MVSRSNLNSNFKPSPEFQTRVTNVNNNSDAIIEVDNIKSSVVNSLKMSSTNENPPAQSIQPQEFDTKKASEVANLADELQSKLVEALSNLFDDAAEQLPSLLYQEDICEIDEIIEVSYEKYRWFEQ